MGITAMDGQAILSLAVRGVLLMLKLLLNQLLRPLLRLKLTSLGMAITHHTIIAMDGQAILSLAARGVLLMLSLKLMPTMEDTTEDTTHTSVDTTLVSRETRLILKPS